MAVTTIGDILTATRDARAKISQTVLNETTLGSYSTLSMELKSAEEMFKGGKRVVDYIDFGTADGGWMDEKNPINPAIVSGVEEISCEWATLQKNYLKADISDSINEQDVDAFFKDVKVRENRCAIGTFDELEKSAWALPNTATMEAANVAAGNIRRPYSYLCFVTRDGLEPSTTNGGVSDGATSWTTLQQLDPQTAAFGDNWKNQYATYSTADPSDLDTGIIPVLENLLDLTTFEVPSELVPYMKDARRNKRYIATTQNGLKIYRAALRKAATLGGENGMYITDPSINGPQMNGIPVKRISVLEASTHTNSGFGTTTNPDFLVLDIGEINTFFRTGFFMKDYVASGGINFPTTTGVFKITNVQRLIRSRRRQGRAYAA